MLILLQDQHISGILFMFILIKLGQLMKSSYNIFGKLQTCMKNNIKKTNYVRRYSLFPIYKSTRDIMDI